MGSLPQADWLLADRGCDAERLREASNNKGISARIPGRKSRKKSVKYDKRRYKKRHRIEIMFGRLKDWKHVATRCDRRPETQLSAVALAAISGTTFRSTCEVAHDILPPACPSIASLISGLKAPQACGSDDAVVGTVADLHRARQ